MNPVAIGIFAALIAAIVIVVVINLGAIGKRKKNSRKSISSSQPAASSDTQWRAVKIKPGLISCNAVASHANQVFLAHSAPRLPLDGCAEKDCRCRYVHLDDRRSGGDRRIELGELGSFLPTSHVERRHSGGRRASDVAA